MIHELPLEPPTIHGQISRELEPVLSIAPGDTVRMRAIDSGWSLEENPAVVVELTGSSA